MSKENNSWESQQRIHKRESTVPFEGASASNNGFNSDRRSELSNRKLGLSPLGTALAILGPDEGPHCTVNHLDTVVTDSEARRCFSTPDPLHHRFSRQLCLDGISFDITNIDRDAREVVEQGETQPISPAMRVWERRW